MSIIYTLKQAKIPSMDPKMGIMRFQLQIVNSLWNPEQTRNEKPPKFWKQSGRKSEEAGRCWPIHRWRIAETRRTRKASTTNHKIMNETPRDADWSTGNNCLVTERKNESWPHLGPHKGYVYSPSPRAATSVATSIECRPLRKLESTKSRSCCDLSPWMAHARQPWREILRVISSTRFLVSTKMMVLVSFSAEMSVSSLISFINFSFSSHTSTIWRMLWLALSESEPMFTCM